MDSCPSAGIIRAANQPSVYEGATAVAPCCWGSITAAGVGEEAAERLPPEEEEESQEHGEGWPVLRASCGRHIKSAGADEAGR